MAKTTTTTKTKTQAAGEKKLLYRFCGTYNNINIGPKLKFNGVKIILHEVMATSLDEAKEFYRLHLIHNDHISQKQLKQYLVDLYFNKIIVEVIDIETAKSFEISTIL